MVLTHKNIALLCNPLLGNEKALEVAALEIKKAQTIFGNYGEYVFHPEAEHKFKKDVRDDQIVVMRLPSKEELENWSKKFREMFR